VSLNGHCINVLKLLSYAKHLIWLKLFYQFLLYHKVIQYDTLQYIYVCSKADEMDSLIKCVGRKRKVRKN